MKLSDNCGTVLRQVDLASQRVNGDLSGLAFDGSGQLLASSNRGIVLRNLDLSGASAAVTSPTIASIAAVAKDGTPAGAAWRRRTWARRSRSWGRGSRRRRRWSSRRGTTRATRGRRSCRRRRSAPTGRTCRRSCPTWRTTGAVTVQRGGDGQPGLRRSSADAIYRGITRTFTATGATAKLTFADGGLRGRWQQYESWGIDNVRVTDAGNADGLRDRLRVGGGPGVVVDGDRRDVPGDVHAVPGPVQQRHGRAVAGRADGGGDVHAEVRLLRDRQLGRQRRGRFRPGRAST